MKEIIASVVSNKKVVPETRLIWLESDLIAATAKPGQFVMVSCGTVLLRRPVSIHQVDGNRFSLLFRIIGAGTQWLAQRLTGSTINLLGPLGNGFTIQPSARKILLVAGGIGIAPLLFLGDVAAKRDIEVTLLMGACSAADCLDLTGYGIPLNINVIKATDDGSLGYKGLVTDLMVNQVNLDRFDQIFACGPLPMYKTMSRMPELKNKPVQVSLEVRMACGLGICYACTVKTREGLKQVCRDGPVFDLSEVLWDEVAC